MRLVLCLLVACGDGPNKTSVRGEGQTLETFEKKMCACRDAACAKQVVIEMAAWSKKIKTARDDVDVMAATMRRYNACMAEATTKKRTP